MMIKSDIMCAGLACARHVRNASYFYCQEQFALFMFFNQSGQKTFSSVLWSFFRTHSNSNHQTSIAIIAKSITIILKMKIHKGSFCLCIYWGCGYGRWQWPNNQQKNNNVFLSQKNIYQRFDHPKWKNQNSCESTKEGREYILYL